VHKCTDHRSAVSYDQGIVLTPLNGTQLVVLLIIAGIAGAVGTALGGRGRSSFVASVGLGLVGAVIGPWVVHQFHLTELVELQVGDQPFPLISTLLGASLTVALLHVASGPRLLRN
jgi:uncharacterized membrane protein YeaQ/YmgE (transglycosylase-associated protein family)